MSQECIEFRNVSKIYNIDSPMEKCALKNVTLKIGKGEFVGIAGLNGSGKSTLARMINGLLLPTTGNVYVNGMCTSDKKTIKKLRSLVGMMFQNPDNQIVSHIVEEDVAFGPTNLGLSYTEVKERTDWALGVLGVEELRNRSPHLLSGGQKQKVAIASALAMQPSYLVLDEPTSMLDTSSRCELISTLNFLNKNYGITIILISHFMEDMTEVNRLIVVDKGEIYLDEAPWKLFASPEKIIDIGINPPEIVSMLNKMREQGHKIESKIMTLDQIEEFICRSLK